MSMPCKLSDKPIPWMSTQFTCAFLMRTYGREEQTWSNCVFCEDAISEPPLPYILYICQGSACTGFCCHTLQIQQKPSNISSSTACFHNYLCFCLPLFILNLCIYCGSFSFSTSQSCLSSCYMIFYHVQLQIVFLALYFVLLLVGFLLLLLLFCLFFLATTSR